MNLNISMIEDVLNREVRPLLSQHHGNIIILSYESNILKFRLTGKCCNCPSAKTTTEEIISEKVRSAFPDIKEVILINEVNPDLLLMAKKLLNKERSQSL